MALTKRAKRNLVLFVVGILFFLLLVGGGVLYYFLRKKSLAFFKQKMGEVSKSNPELLALPQFRAASALAAFA